MLEIDDFRYLYIFLRFDFRLKMFSICGSQQWVWLWSPFYLHLSTTFIYPEFELYNCVLMFNRESAREVECCQAKQHIHQSDMPDLRDHAIYITRCCISSIHNKTNIAQERPRNVVFLQSQTQDKPSCQAQT